VLRVGVSTGGVAQTAIINPTGINYLVAATAVGGNMTITIFGTDSNASLPTYTVNFAANGGTGTALSTTPAVGADYTLPANPFTRADFEFVGWSTVTEPDVAGATYYSVGQVVTGGLPGGTAGATITLNAIWRRIQYLFTINAQNATVSTSTSNLAGFTFNAATGIGTGTIFRNQAFNFAIVAAAGYGIQSVTITSGTNISGTSIAGTIIPETELLGNPTGQWALANAQVGSDITVTVICTTTVVPGTPTVTNIVRVSGAAEYSNNATATRQFTVTIDPAPATTPANTAFQVQNGTIAAGNVTGSAGTYTVTVTPSAGIGTSASGDIIRITGITSGSGLGWAATTNQEYNIRTSFMATAQYSPTSSVVQSSQGSVRITFSEELGSNTAPTLSATLTPTTGGGSSVPLNLTGTPGTGYSGTYTNLLEYTQYTVTLTGGPVMDRWGNTWTLGTWTFTTNGPVVTPRMEQLILFSITRGIEIAWRTNDGATGIVIQMSNTRFPANPTAPVTSSGNVPTGEDYTTAYHVVNNINELEGRINWIGLQRNTKYHFCVWAYNGTTLTHYLTDSAITGARKEGFVDSRFATFAVSEITPHPVVEEAEFSVLTDEAGIMNISIHDLAGSKVMQLVDNRYVYAKTETFIKLDKLSNIASGAYNLIITLGDDRVEKTIIIRK